MRANRNAKMCKQTRNPFMEHRSKPGQRDLESRSKNKFSVAIFLKKKVDQSKKKLTNQIRAVSRPSYEYLCRHCLEALEFNNLP